MKSVIRKIGNFKGIIIPQRSLKECLIENDVCMEVKDQHIIISAANNEKRKGWAKAFKQMAGDGDDQLAIPGIFNDEDVSNWTW